MKSSGSGPYSRVDSAQRRGVAMVVRALLPASVGSDAATVDAVVDEVFVELSFATSDEQRALSMVFGQLGSPLLGHGLASRDSNDTDRAMQRLLTHPIAPLRSAAHVVRRAVSLLAWGGATDGTRRLPMSCGYPGPRDDRPKIEAPIATASLADVPSSVDVVVVGSGPGGSVAAALFAAAGRSVLVIEAGSLASPSSFSQRDLDEQRRLYLDRGATMTSDGGVSILAGATVGGGTVVNWSASLRIDDAIGADWDEASGLAGLSSSLAPHYDAVARRLGLTTPSAPEVNENNAALERGCERLGWKVAPIARNASGCGDGCGYCGFGCAYGKKRDMTRTYLRDAVDRGAQIVADTQVDRVVVARDGARRRAVGVEVRGRDGGVRTLGAKTVVMAAGALRTPAILGRSAIRSAALGRGLRLHPTALVFGVFEEAIEPWRGPPMSRVYKGAQRMERSHGAVVEVAPMHPALGAVAMPWWTRAGHAADVRALSRTACAIAITRDRDGGTVVDGPEKPAIDYRVSRFDGAHLLAGMSSAARILHAAGAQALYTTHTPPVRWARGDGRSIDDFARSIVAAGHAQGRLGVFSAHQMATARMHASAERGVIDERGAVHGVGGLIVTDASTFPAASGVNPMLTILAMARRITLLHGGVDPAPDDVR